MSKFWNFAENECGVDLYIKGVIDDDNNQWMYDWLGQVCTSPTNFRNELSKYAGKTVNVWIDSYGGDVFAGTGLYDALMNHKKTGSKIVTKGEKVFSAATLPFMAGDVREMSPGGIFMMHNPLTDVQGYASDLRKTADVLDVVKESILNVYQTTTGLPRDVISDLMDKETHMSPQDAVKNKMATAVIESPGNSPLGIFNINKLAIMNAANISKKGIIRAIENFDLLPKEGREEDNMDIKNVEDLKKAFPDLVKQIESPQTVDDAVKAERKRITDLDKIDDSANEALHKIVNHAKENGQTADEIQFYVDAVKNISTPSIDEMKKIINDSETSHVDEIESNPRKPINDKEKSKAFSDLMANAIKNIKGGK